MKTLEWTTIDKTSWPRGPWDHEPDKKQWPDSETGYPCLANRNKATGNWCGYVGLFETHPDFQKPYREVDVLVHGGLSFGGLASKHRQHRALAAIFSTLGLTEDPSVGISHVTEPGENARVWWLGFDTSHGADWSPAYKAPANTSGIYKTLAYVEREVTRLARQLKTREEDHALG